MVFVFDLDDTICDTDGYSEKYIRDFIFKNNLPYKQIAKEVRYAEAKFDWDLQTAIEWYKQYGDEMMAQFPCKKDTVEIINNLHDNGHKIVIATARATDWHTEPEKITLRWLQKVGLKYDKIYIGRIDKEKICEEENADIFIDDDIKIVSRVADYFKNKKGKYTFLSTTEYNRNLQVPEGVIRVYNLKEFLSFINLNIFENKK